MKNSIFNKSIKNLEINCICISEPNGAAVVGFENKAIDSKDEEANNSWFQNQRNQLET